MIFMTSIYLVKYPSLPGGLHPLTKPLLPRNNNSFIEVQARLSKRSLLRPSVIWPFAEM